MPSVASHARATPANGLANVQLRRAANAQSADRAANADPRRNHATVLPRKAVSVKRATRAALAVELQCT